MNTWKILAFLPVFILMFAFASAAGAHLPYLERGAIGVNVRDPEISKAYYGWLQGAPAVYLIAAEKPFLLYLNILSPRIENGRMDYSAAVYKDGEVFARVDADDSFWPVSYEPFANDYYLKGPEYEAKVPAGNYEIKIYNSGNSGNYVLAVGKIEDLSPGQFLRTLAVLPRVKEEFFGKNWWQAYNNLVGLSAFVMAVFLLAVIYFVVSFIRNRRLKRRLDVQYAKR